MIYSGGEEAYPGNTHMYGLLLIPEGMKALRAATQYADREWQIMTESSSFVSEDIRRQRMILFSVAFASFMVNVDTYIVNISLPTIARAFGASTGDVSWIVLSYQLTITSLLMIFGKLGDRLGLKRVFIWGFGLFTLSSLFCGISPNLEILVLSRFIQGIGASVLYALTPAMVPRFLPEKVRGPAFGSLATATALGITVGTPLGGIITGFLSWHWIFLVNIPVGIAAIIVCQRVMPDDRPSAENGSEKKNGFDLAGALLSFVSSLTLIYGLSEGKDNGWLSPVIIGSFLLFAGTFYTFIRHEKSTKTPLLDLSLFRSRAFTFGNIASGLAYAFLAGNNFLMPFFLMNVKGLKSETAGFVFLTYSLVYMAVGPISGRLSLRISPRMLCTFGMALGGLSALLFSATLEADGMTWVFVYFVLLAVSIATFCTSNNNVVMGMAPEGKQGIVSGVFRMIMRFGMALGVCLFEMVFSLAAASTVHTGKAAMGKLTSGMLISGFHVTYIAGAVVCFLAMAASIIARDGGAGRAEP